MVKHKVVRITAILLIIVVSITEYAFGQEHEISKLKFSFEHALRIPDHYVTVVFLNAHDSVRVYVTSNPATKVSKKWDKTKRNYSFNISKEEFNKIVTSITQINCSDVLAALTYRGNDGTSCEIELSNYSNAIKYRVWSPNYNTEKRNLHSFLNACKLILLTARLNPDEIF
jgi:hypothetical protein